MKKRRLKKWVLNLIIAISGISLWVLSIKIGSMAKDSNIMAFASLICWLIILCILPAVYLAVNCERGGLNE